MDTTRTLLRPSEVEIPSSCEGWEELYAYHLPFGEDRRARDDGRFWFREELHGSEPLYPFDALAVECAAVAFSQVSSRFFVIPPSQGAEIRVLNGYLYVALNAVTDEAELARRTELFARRGGYYYEHWDELYAGWVQRVEGELDRLDALQVPELAEFEDEALVTGGRGLGSGHALLASYDALLAGLDRIWQYHCELLNLGYGGYLVFFDVCRQAFPGIADRTVAKMVAGIEVLVLRPDDELRRLAALALQLGVGPSVKGAAGEAELRAGLWGSEQGRHWLADFDATKDPWFNFSTGNAAWYHDHRSWRDDPALPIATIGRYIERLEAGEEIARPYDAIVAERERITAEYRALLPEEMRQKFDESLQLARTVFPFIENHNFYIDHWYMTRFWNKVREFGALLASYRFLDDRDDVFFLRHDEVRAALGELRQFWSAGCVGTPRGPVHWPALVARRREIHRAMRAWQPPPALGVEAAESLVDPVGIMLYGVTSERVQAWLDGAGSADGLTGATGSPGVAQGIARVILHPDQLPELQPGEILVAPSTYPSWTPVFGTIAAAVLDTGGVMCHAAIVAREYGLPAVVGTGLATTRIKTGDRIRVDADNGVVTVLS